MNANGSIKRTITLEGGFHNSKATTVTINIPNIDLPLEGFQGRDIDELYISESQIKRLNRHFCGISGCKCGGYLRAEITKIK